METWFDVDSSEINREVTKNLFGVAVKVSFSPYDVPRKYRGYRDEISNQFIIEFQYLTEEQTESPRPSVDCPIQLEVGENSKRVHKIILDLEKIKGESVKLEIEPIARNVVKVIREFSFTVPEKMRARYKMPESIVFNHQDRIFSDLAAS